MKTELSTVKAIVFDTFGTVVDWRGSIIRDLSCWGRAQNIQAEASLAQPEPMPGQPAERPPRHSKVRAPQFHASGHGDLITK